VTFDHHRRVIVTLIDANLPVADELLRRQKAVS